MAKYQKGQIFRIESQVFIGNGFTTYLLINKFK